MKRYIFTALALIALAVNAVADTTKLLEADGWTKITTLPSASNIAKNYYVFVDNSNDLMLGIAKGSHNNGKWYSLSLWYQTSVSPTTSAILSKLWILKKGSYSDGSYAIQNVEYPDRLLQTEYNKGYLMETNDVSSPNDWSKLNFAYSDGSWTIENGQYPASSSAGYKGHLGPWDENNTNTNIQDGQELAGNKSGNYIGHFQIYAISRAQFEANYLAAASSSNAVDVSFIYVNNPTLDLNIDGWTRSASTLQGHASANYCTETWHSSTDFKFYQDITSLPEGAYQVSVQARSETNSGSVYVTVNGNTVSTPVNTTTSSSSMQTEATTMLDRTTGKITTPTISLEDGQTLTMGFMDNVANHWDVFDNFKLYYLGNDLLVYETARDEVKATAEAAIASNLVPDACEEAIQSAINANDGDYSSKTEYITAKNAIQTAIDTYFTDELKSAYAAYKTMRTNVQGLENSSTYHYTDPGSAKSTLDGAILSANTSVEAATTVSVINAQKDAIRAAALTFISHVTAEDGNPFNLTFLASTAAADWQTASGLNPAATAPAWSVPKPDASMADFVESYTEAAGGESITGNILYQTLSGMPAGYYTVALYAAASYTPNRGSLVEKCTDGQPNITFGFAGESTLSLPVVHRTSLTAADQVPVNLSVQLTEAGILSFGIKKTAAGSNWHVAQIYTITYSKAPDLTILKADRDALVSEAEGVLASNDANLLTAAQKSALQDAINTANSANNFDALNTVTLTMLPNAIQIARQQIQQVKDNRVLMIAALERFENDYNLTDGTDYRRSTMSAAAWATLIEKVNAVTTALDDVSLGSEYAARKNALIAQMDATDVSLRLFKSYKAMAAGTPVILDGTLSSLSSIINNSNMDTDASEQTIINSLNDAVEGLSLKQCEDFSMNAFLGDNLDFSSAEGAALNTENSNNIHAVSGWEVSYADADTWAVIQTHQNDNDSKLYMRKNWGSSATTLVAQKQRMLPIGKYTLSLSWNSNMQNMTNLSCFKVGDTSTPIGETTDGAKTLTYSFEVTDEAKPFDLVIGFKKTGTGNTPAQLVVDDISLTMNRVVNDVCDKFVIVDTDPVSITKSFTATSLENSRTLTQSDDAYTICLPYALNSNDDVQFYELSSAAGGTLHFTEVATTEPLKPYLAIAKQNASLSASNVEVVATTSGSSDVSADGYTMKGTLTRINRDDAESLGAYILQSDNKWKKVDNGSSASVYIPAFRAYIVANDPSSARLLSSSFGDETTSVGAIRKETLEAELYDLNGRLVGRMPLSKGFYVRNGKKVIIK